MADYAGFMAESATGLDCFYDVSGPHPKEAIIAAIERGDRSVPA